MYAHVPLGPSSGSVSGVLFCSLGSMLAWPAVAGELQQPEAYPQPESNFLGLG